MQDNKFTSTKTVNGIELKEGQVWTTTSFGDVTLSKKGVSTEYPWYCSSDECSFSITEDGKYWEEDDEPILLELIKEETTVNKFNPKPGDKIICNNGEEFICCTLEFLQQAVSPWVRSDKPILGYDKGEEEWQDWDEDGRSSPSLTELHPLDIREVIPVEPNEVAEQDNEPRYTVDEVFFAIKQHVGYESPLDYKDGIKRLLKNLDEDPQYKEYLRLKAIYE